ncbi:MAG: branched-chain amino acid ABC transporter permease [Syntrophales bacterium]
MKRGLFVFILFVCALAAVPLFLSDPFLCQILIMIMMYATMSIGWNVIGGYAGQVSFGNAAFFGIGAYTTAILLVNFSVNPWLGMLAGCVLSVGLAVVVGYPCFRLRGHYFAIATIAVGEIMVVIFTNWDYVGAAVGIYMPILEESIANFEFHSSKIPYYYIILCMLLFAIAVSYVIERSRLGYYLRAVKDDPDGARSVGIDIQKYKLIAFSISAVLTSICGTFYGQYVLYIHPSSTMDLMMSIHLCIIALIGGIGKLFGPVVGAFVFIPLMELTRVYLGSEGQGIDMIIYSLLVIMIAIWRPQGLWALFSRGDK